MQMPWERVPLSCQPSLPHGGQLLEALLLHGLLLCTGQRLGRYGHVGRVPSQALEVHAVLLQVASHVLPGHSLHIHQLQDSPRHRMLYAQVGNSVHETGVQLIGPSQARSLAPPGLGSLSAAAPAATAAAIPPGRGTTLPLPLLRPVLAGLAHRVAAVLWLGSGLGLLTRGLLRVEPGEGVRKGGKRGKGRGVSLPFHAPARASNPRHPDWRGCRCC